MDDQAYGDRVRGRRQVALDVGPCDAGAALMMRRVISLVLCPSQLDIKDPVGRNNAGLMARAVRVGMVMMRVRRAELFNDEHERKAEQKRQSDRGSFQRGGWSTVR